MINGNSVEIRFQACLKIDLRLCLLCVCLLRKLDLHVDLSPVQDVERVGEGKFDNSSSSMKFHCFNLLLPKYRIRFLLNES